MIGRIVFSGGLLALWAGCAWVFAWIAHTVLGLSVDFWTVLAGFAGAAWLEQLWKSSEWITSEETKRRRTEIARWRSEIRGR